MTEREKEAPNSILIPCCWFMQATDKCAKDHWYKCVNMNNGEIVHFSPITEE